MQQSYDNSTDGRITLDATRGNVEIRDASPGLSTDLFVIASNDGVTKHMSVSSSTVSIRGNISASYGSHWSVPGYTANRLWNLTTDGTADTLVIQPPGDGYGELTLNTKSATGGIRGESVRVTYDGKVGINIPVPQHTLDISQSGSDSNLRIISQTYRAELLMGLTDLGAHINIVTQDPAYPEALTITADSVKRLGITAGGKVEIPNRINISGTTPPATSMGSAGDMAGDVAVDSGYIYYCTANHTDGISPIWVRAQLSSW